ncbi:DUF4192 domain-containing protein [Arthrobacter sp. 7Tela_A1]|uniref:DUF4192 domain-containing protein n=1 Tax=Arthrobacter sp. 7Tela_A1 TaxID=3093745 RepID=UPI003BB71E5A
MNEFAEQRPSRNGTSAEAENAVLKVGSPADILAFVPHCLGFVPQESLVLLALRGPRLGATLRLDLPSAGTMRGMEASAGTAGHGFAAGYSARVCSLLAGDAEADGVLVLVYTDIPWEPEEEAPYAALIARLSKDLAGAGLEVRDGWLAGNGHWRDYFCSSAQCCPWPGHPLDQVHGSALNAELVYRGSAYSPSLEAAVGLAGAGVRNPETARSEEASRLRFTGSWTQAATFRATLAHWEERLYVPGGPARDGLLLASLEAKPVRDAVLVLAALGLNAAVDGARHWLAPAGAGPDSPDPNGLSGTPDAGHVFRSVLIGRSREAPDWDRLDRAYLLFHSLLADADGEPAAALLTLLGWLEWARGRSSRADVCLSAALRAQPGYRLAQLLRALLIRGDLPVWTQSPKTAWRGPSSG